MVAGGVGVPNPVIENVGDGLDWTIVPAKRSGKEIVAERFRDQKRALDERIVAREV